MLRERFPVAYHGMKTILLVRHPVGKDREKMEEKNALTQEQKDAILKVLNDPNKREALITFLKNEERRLAELRQS